MSHLCQCILLLVQPYFDYTIALCGTQLVAHFEIEFKLLTWNSKGHMEMSMVSMKLHCSTWVLKTL